MRALLLKSVFVFFSSLSSLPSLHAQISINNLKDFTSASSRQELDKSLTSYGFHPSSLDQFEDYVAYNPDSSLKVKVHRKFTQAELFSNMHSIDSQWKSEVPEGYWQVRGSLQESSYILRKGEAMFIIHKKFPEPIEGFNYIATYIKNSLPNWIYFTPEDMFYLWERKDSIDFIQSYCISKGYRYFKDLKEGKIFAKDSTESLEVNWEKGEPKFLEYTVREERVWEVWKEELRDMGFMFIGTNNYEVNVQGESYISKKHRVFLFILTKPTHKEYFLTIESR